MKNTILTKTIAGLLVVFALAFTASAQTPINAEQDYFNKALEAIQKDDYAGAEKNARQVIRINPKSGEGYAILAAALGMLGREQEAEAAAQKAFELLPKDSVWRKRLEELMAGDEGNNNTAANESAG